MKQCPVCRTTYTDESLRFCLVDGASLSKIEQPATPSAAKKRTWAPALAAFGIIGAFFLAATLVAVAILWRNTGGRNASERVAPTAATPAATPDQGRELLTDAGPDAQIRNSERSSADRQSTEKPFPGPDDPGIVTARVNSPKDRFLALRDRPDPRTGKLIVKIPHGSVVALNNCEKTRVTVDTRSGRWCQVEYEKQTGWVFDAWLNY